ncbi:hypothetical protein KDD17_14605 [Sulfitobacter albidus]|uniref:Phosphoribulokinase/uridine kinase domain-containing protein n=1 Tax=Sulfitobacter albidus TaxID=2829501 RepID=A0A975PNP7_9RHOB|nr:hypothetical protein KDD17_14605 [Sulfitobacter albidus]
MDIAALAREISDRNTARDRLIVAIAGAPGSGKSTLAEDLANRLGAGAAVLPMDGFHLDNATLRAAGLFAHKGAPNTFDAAGFIALLREVRAGGAVSYPTFDRNADATVPGGGMIDADTRIVLAEGNYLLLDNAPWDRLAPLCDLTVQLHVPRHVLEQRLIDRWLAYGLDPEAARARALGNDMRNVDTVVSTSRPADYVIRQS